MAEYRAHEDALRRIYLSPGVEDQGLGSEFPALPSDTLIESEGYVYQAPKTLGDLEVDEASAANRSGRMADQSFEDILFARRQESLLKFKTALASRSTLPLLSSSSISCLVCHRPLVFPQSIVSNRSHSLCINP
ncbi:hypothetical protein KEM48_011812 [Puccinia striiformis f. sp. tritici PST-130]|nr:hypothetical protein KEM48_011812 [Puccinia striiformis f. sp. tritici PST-130]